MQGDHKHRQGMVLFDSLRLLYFFVVLHGKQQYKFSFVKTSQNKTIVLNSQTISSNLTSWGGRAEVPCLPILQYDIPGIARNDGN